MTSTDTLEPTELDVPPARAAQHASETTSEPDAISAEMSRAFQRLMEYVERHDLQIVGPPRSIYTGYEPTTVRFITALPIHGGEDLPDEDLVTVGALPSGPVLRFTHVGPYDTLAGTYNAITAWMIEQGRMESEADWARYSPMWEEYVTDPETTPSDKLVTYIFLPTGS